MAPGAEIEDGTPADGGGEDDEEEPREGWDSGKQAACILFHSLDGSKVRRFGGLSNEWAGPSDLFPIRH